ncbi:hypothetical protein BDD12DRAFT_894384 [Trichophaea hybrida]|nr:hypothetical protein BDD12DRAFT_894384 [Trichophaea hybrida]
MARSVAVRRQPRQSMVFPQPAAGSSSGNGIPWYHDPDYTDDIVNLLRDPNDETPQADKAYIIALEHTWVECYAAAGEQAATIEELPTENENLQAAGGVDEADRAARDAFAAISMAEVARQETAGLRAQLAAAEETLQSSEAAVRMMMAASTRIPDGVGNTTNTFTIHPKRLPVFKGERDMPVGGDFNSDLQRQFEARSHKIE